MTSGAEIRRSLRQTRIVTAVVFLILAVIVVVASAEFWRQRAEQSLRAQAAETLAVQTEALTRILDKYRLLPPLLSREASIVSLFDAGGHASDAARSKAIDIHGMSGAKEVVLFYPDGRVLAAARGFFGDSVPDQDELLEAARQGRLGRQAIALPSGQRVYGFSSGIWRGEKLLGIVAVYVDFDPVEETWSLSTNPIFVTDSSDTVFLTNRPGWRMQSASAVMSTGNSPDRLLLGTARVPHGDLTRDLPLLGWRLHVLSDERPLLAAQWTGALIATLFCLLIGAGLAFLIQRREAGALQRRRDRATALRLERLVRERTRELSETNLSLSREIDERRLTEEQLRKTQAELVQAAKLAVLGQMSAALSHEFNQPLAALRTYSDNAQRFLENGKTDRVSDNLSRIGRLIDRMAGLSRSLLSFSRKPGTQTKAVALGPVLDEALMLARPRAGKAGVELALVPCEPLPEVLGGHIRLSQVFVNLINNGIDAASGSAGARVEIAVDKIGHEVVVRIGDSGPGVPAGDRDTVFEPFYTTKEVGSGIGIGLSIVASIVHDFDGTIELRDSALGGAEFAVHLRHAESDQIAAE